MDKNEAEEKNITFIYVYFCKHFHMKQLTSSVQLFHGNL